MPVNPGRPFVPAQFVDLGRQRRAARAGALIHCNGGKCARQRAPVERIPFRDQRDFGIAVSGGARFQIDLAALQLLQKLFRQCGIGADGPGQPDLRAREQLFHRLVCLPACLGRRRPVEQKSIFGGGRGGKETDILQATGRWGAALGRTAALSASRLNRRSSAGRALRKSPLFPAGVSAGMTPGERRCLEGQRDR